MSDAGRKIIEGLHEALAGNLARITIDGVTWVRKEELKRKDAEIERLRKALETVVSDILEYEKINNLAPNPGRQYCWDSIAEAMAALTASEAALPGHPPAAAQPKTESRS